MLAATQDDLLQAVVAAGAVLLFILLVWIILHHTHPELGVDIGVRGWIKLTRPPKVEDEVPPEEPAEPVE